MAVKVAYPAGEETAKILALFGVETLPAPGVSAVISNTKLVLKANGKTEEVAITAGAVQLAQAGTLGSYTKKVIGAQVSNAMGKLTGGAFFEEKVIPAPSAADKWGKSAGQKAAMTKLAKKAGAGKKPQKKPVAFEVDSSPPSPISSITGDEVPEAEMDKIERVLLRDATRLYQPVKATSNNSRYFLVAGDQALRVAARIKNNSVSMRVEGQVHENVQRLKDVGFEVKLSDEGTSYASLHVSYDANDLVMASKIIGSAVLGLGLAGVTKLPEAKRLVGKGG